MPKLRYDADWAMAAADYRAAKIKLDEAKRLFDIRKDKLLQLTDEDASGFGVAVKFTERKGSIDYAKVVKENLPDIELEPYRKDTSSVVRVDIAKED